MIRRGEAEGTAGTVVVDAVIREARARQQRRRRRFALSLTILAGVAGAYLGVWRTTTATPRPTTPPRSIAGIGPFVGYWHVHANALTISANGIGLFDWPIHLKCTRGTPPTTACDTEAPTTFTVDGVRRSGTSIINGGHANLTIKAVDGGIASGEISETSDPGGTPDGPVTLVLDTAKDVLAVSVRGMPPGDFERSPLCGRFASKLSVAEQQHEGINCGA